MFLDDSAVITIHTELLSEDSSMNESLYKIFQAEILTSLVEPLQSWIGYDMKKLESLLRPSELKGHSRLTRLPPTLKNHARHSSKRRYHYSEH